eukprot:10322448-Karenia_brevis.AAC.1
MADLRAAASAMSNSDLTRPALALAFAPSLLLLGLAVDGLPDDFLAAGSSPSPAADGGVVMAAGGGGFAGGNGAVTGSF